VKRLLSTSPTFQSKRREEKRRGEERRGEERERE
jgi:hypothetical protein